VPQGTLVVVRRRPLIGDHFGQAKVCYTD
jgi:hypothetical protein